jgi:hypothetical protein
MPGRVFISCGQADFDERETAAAVESWFSQEGFQPWVAIQTQGLVDTNTAIIEELKRADFYVFIDFAREVLVRDDSPNEVPRPTRRGSLFTNQELAIAHVLGFGLERAIFLQQAGVKREGMLAYMASNARGFESHAEVPGLVKELVEEREVLLHLPWTDPGVWRPWFPGRDSESRPCPSRAIAA